MNKPDGKLSGFIIFAVDPCGTICTSAGEVRKGGFLLSKFTEKRREKRLKKRTMERIERNKRTMFDYKDLTPFNVGRVDWNGRNIAYK